MFKIGLKHLAKLQAKWLFHAPHSHCTFALKDADLTE